jgi:hypothetical protein
MVRVVNQYKPEDVPWFRYEYQFQNWLMNAAHARGWLAYHTKRSDGSRKGFPDTVLTRERTVYAELKMEDGTTQPDQWKWLEALARAGDEVYLWRPRHMPVIGRILA